MNTKVTGFFVTAALSLLFLTGCESNPTDPTKNKDTNFSEQAKENSLEVYQTVSSVQRVSDVLRGPDAKLEFSSPSFSSTDEATAMALAVKSDLFAKLPVYSTMKQRYNTVQGDSLLWELTERKQAEGYTETVRYYHDFETGISTLEMITYNYDARHNLERDSARIVVDVNFTLDDESDDVLRSMSGVKKYKPGNLIDEEIVHITLGDYEPGTEPTSGTFKSTVLYNESNYILKTEEQADLRAENDGEWQREIQYSDGSTSTEKVTFRPDGTGTFEETQKNGTKTTGEFNIVEDDGQGSFTVLTVYPEGSDPVSESESGTFTLDAVDSTLHGEFQNEIKFKDGTILSEKVKVDESYEDGIKVTKIRVESSDGSSADLRIEERPDGDRVHAEVVEADGTFIIADVIYFSDSSARLTFKIYTSKQAYENGEEPVASGLINFNPDGSGSGSVTDSEGEHEVTVDPSGN